MTYYGAKELADSFRTVRKNTILIAEEIPEDKYNFRASPDTRTVAQMLTHIAASQKMPEQIHAIERRKTLEGFDFPALFQRIMAEEQTPPHPHDLSDAFARAGAQRAVDAGVTRGRRDGT